MIRSAQLREYLTEDIQAALGAKFPVAQSPLRLPVSLGSGYAVISSIGVAQGFGNQASVTQVAQEFTVQIDIVRPWPAQDVLIIEEEESDVNALLPYLQPGPQWHSWGYMPIVTEVHYNVSGEDVNERRHTVALMFKTFIYEPHH